MAAWRRTIVLSLMLSTSLFGLDGGGKLVVGARLYADVWIACHSVGFLAIECFINLLSFLVFVTFWEFDLWQIYLIIYLWIFCQNRWTHNLFMQLHLVLQRPMWQLLWPLCLATLVNLKVITFHRLTLLLIKIKIKIKTEIW